jgi:hypothetical protein
MQHFLVPAFLPFALISFPLVGWAFEEAFDSELRACSDRVSLTHCEREVNAAINLKQNTVGLHGNQRLGTGRLWLGWHSK